MSNLESLREAAAYFSDPDVCRQYLLRIRWPGDKITCPACTSSNIGRITTRDTLNCRECHKQFSPRVGTVMEDSPLSTGKWLTAIWAWQHGVDGARLAEVLNVQHKTAWRMLRRIKATMEGAAPTTIDHPGG